MKKDLPKTYDPKLVESAIYDMWMENDCFKAEPDPDKKPYSIVMPPPNVTGQPSVENGHRPDENQVSSTSSSRVRCVQPHFSHFVGSSRETLIWPHSSQYHAGI